MGAEAAAGEGICVCAFACACCLFACKRARARIYLEGGRKNELQCDGKAFVCRAGEMGEVHEKRGGGGGGWASKKLKLLVNIIHVTICEPSVKFKSKTVSQQCKGLSSKWNQKLLVSIEDRTRDLGGVSTT